MVAHHPLDQDGGVVADPGCLPDQVRRRGRRVGIALVRLGHVLLDVTWPQRCERRTWLAARL